MTKNLITAERLRQLLHYDPATGVFTWVSKTGTASSGKVAGTPHKQYIRIQADKRLYRAHRLAWLHVNGQWPSAEIDHVNGDGTDNRWANLRPASRCFNMQNQRKAQKHNSTGLLGACVEGHRFRARLSVNGKKLSLGMFATAELAHAAYVAAKRNFHHGNTL